MGSVVLRACAATVALAGGLLAAGCLMPPSPEAIQEELVLARQGAYDVWKHDRDNIAEAVLRGPLTLEDAIKAALQYNKVLQQVVEKRGVARGQVIEAYQLALPSVVVSGDYSHYQQLSSAPWNYLNEYSTGVTIQQPLGQGVAIPAAQRTARLVAALADEEVRGMVQNVMFQTATAYYAVLLSQHLYDANREAVISAEAHLRVVELYRREGTVSDFEVLRARVDVANFQAQMIIQKNAIDTQRTALLKIVGVSQESEITLADKLTFEPMRPVFERAVEIALTNRSDLFQADLNVNVQREALRIAKSQWWPAFGAFFSQSWSMPDPQAARMSRNTFNNGRWVAGVQGTWTLSPWETSGRIMQQRAGLQIAEFGRMDAQESALEELRRAIYAVANAEELVKSQQLNTEAAKEATRLAMVGYEAGANKELDVITARAAETTAVSNYYNALHGHTQARLLLQIAMGILGPQVHQAGAVPTELPAVPGRIAEFAVNTADFDARPATPVATSTFGMVAPASAATVNAMPVAVAAPLPVPGISVTDMPAPVEAIPALTVVPAGPSTFDAAENRTTTTFKVTVAPVVPKPAAVAPEPTATPKSEPVAPAASEVPAGPRLVAKVTVRPS